MEHRGRMHAKHRTGVSSWEAIVSNGKNAGDRDGRSKPPYLRKQRVDINTEVLPGEDVPMEDARRLVADPYLIFCVV